MTKFITLTTTQTFICASNHTITLDSNSQTEEQATVFCYCQHCGSNATFTNQRINQLTTSLVDWYFMSNHPGYTLEKFAEEVKFWFHGRTFLFNAIPLALQRIKNSN